MSDIVYFSVGIHKYEMDFSVSCAVANLSYEEMRQLREMIVVGIGAMEEMWRHNQKLPADQCVKPTINGGME